jgi:type I restriction enzyme M protein
MASYSSLFKLYTSDIKSEAEVETKLLAKLFNDLEYTDSHIVPKKRMPSLLAFNGSKKQKIEADFLLKDSNGNPRVIVEAKDPSKNIEDAFGQAASYALSYNKDKEQDKRVRWLLISNGHITSLYPHDSCTPIVTLQLSDFASGSPAYVTLRTYIKHKAPVEIAQGGLEFKSIPPEELNTLFFQCHDLVWKKEKRDPTDAFFEFCKFIFLKIREDKKRDLLPKTIQPYELPLTSKWLEMQEKTSTHPVRDILFKALHDELEVAIPKGKKRIFEKTETLKLGASVCKDLVKKFETINLSTIDEDLNGRMFEVFLAAAIRGKALGQYFTPRPVVDFMTRLALYNKWTSGQPS